MTFNSNVSLNKKQQVQDSPFLSLSKRVKEGISSESIYGNNDVQGLNATQGTNIFGMPEANPTNTTAIGQVEKKGADEYFAEDENGEMAFDQNSFYGDAWGVSFSNSASSNPIKAGSAKTGTTSATKQADTTELKEELTSLVKSGATSGEIEDAKEELKTAGVSDSEIEEIEEEATEEKTGSTGSTGTTNVTTVTTASSLTDKNTGMAAFMSGVNSLTPSVTVTDCTSSSEDSDTSQNFSFTDLVNGAKTAVDTATTLANAPSTLSKIGTNIANIPENVKAGWQKTTNFVTGNGFNTDEEVADNQNIEKAEQELEAAKAAKTEEDTKLTKAKEEQTKATQDDNKNKAEAKKEYQQADAKEKQLTQQKTNLEGQQKEQNHIQTTAQTTFEQATKDINIYTQAMNNANSDMQKYASGETKDDAQYKLAKSAYDTAQANLQKAKAEQEAAKQKLDAATTQLEKNINPALEKLNGTDEGSIKNASDAKTTAIKKLNDNQAKQQIETANQNVIKQETQVKEAEAKVREKETALNQAKSKGKKK